MGDSAQPNTLFGLLDAGGEAISGFSVPVELRQTRFVRRADRSKGTRHRTCRSRDSAGCIENGQDLTEDARQGN